MSSQDLLGRRSCALWLQKENGKPILFGARCPCAQLSSSICVFWKKKSLLFRKLYECTLHKIFSFVFYCMFMDKSQEKITRLVVAYKLGIGYASLFTLIGPARLALWNHHHSHHLPLRLHKCNLYPILNGLLKILEHDAKRRYLNKKDLTTCSLPYGSLTLVQMRWVITIYT